LNNSILGEQAFEQTGHAKHTNNERIIAENRIGTVLPLIRS
jgi:hypothetical protein